MPEDGTVVVTSRPSEQPPYAITPDMLSCVAETGEASRREFLHAFGLSDRKALRERWLLPAVQRGYVVMTRPDAPNAGNQRFRLTALGRRVRSWAR